MGLFAGIQATRGAVASVEASWMQKGTNGLRLTTVDIPVTVGASVPTRDRRWRVRAYSGIGIGIRIGCSSERPVFACEEARDVEWTWPFGLTVARVSRSGGFVGVDIRYSYGLSDVFGFDSRTRAWQFRLSYGLPLDRN